jgi:hypothetical protein
MLTAMSIQTDLESVVYLVITKLQAHSICHEPYFSNCKAVPTPCSSYLIFCPTMTTRSSLFRPCIDLHNGQVKQIVGGTLSEQDPESLKTNFVAT